MSSESLLLASTQLTLLCGTSHDRYPNGHPVEIGQLDGRLCDMPICRHAGSYLWTAFELVRLGSWARHQRKIRIINDAGRPGMEWMRHAAVEVDGWVVEAEHRPLDMTIVCRCFGVHRPHEQIVPPGWALDSAVEEGRRAVYGLDPED